MHSGFQKSDMQVTSTNAHVQKVHQIQTLKLRCFFCSSEQSIAILKQIDIILFFFGGIAYLGEWNL